MDYFTLFFIQVIPFIIAVSTQIMAQIFKFYYWKVVSFTFVFSTIATWDIVYAILHILSVGDKVQFQKVIECDR